jgi:hypothetical protein
VVSGKEEKRGVLLGVVSCCRELRKIASASGYVEHRYSEGSRGESCDGFTSVLRPGFDEGR